MYILYTYMNMYVQMMYQNERGKEKHTRGKTTTHKHKHMSKGMAHSRVKVLT